MQPALVALRRLQSPCGSWAASAAQRCGMPSPLSTSAWAGRGSNSHASEHDKHGHASPAATLEARLARLEAAEAARTAVHAFTGDCWPWAAPGADTMRWSRAVERCAAAWTQPPPTPPRALQQG